jgi:hypothetical protein
MTLPTTSPLLPLQTSVFTRLNADLSPTTAHSEVPQNTAYPYVVIGHDSGADFGTRDRYGLDVEVTIDCYSRDTGTDELKNLVDSVLASMASPVFVVTGWQVSVLNFSGVEINELGDGESRLATVTYQFILMET